MHTVELLETAIRERKPIRFRYAKAGKTPDIRFGHPYALFVHRNGNALCSVFQTSGATDTDERLPNWRSFEARAMTDLEILWSEPRFGIEPKYHAPSSRIARPIAQV